MGMSSFYTQNYNTGDEGLKREKASWAIYSFYSEYNLVLKLAVLAISTL